MARRRRPKKQQNHERWLITYSDLITLLLVFFVIMFAMSDINKVRFATLAKSLYSALHQGQQIPLQGLGTSSILLSGSQNTGDQSPLPVQIPSAAPNNVKSTSKDQQQLANLYQIVKSYIDKHHLGSQVSVANEPRGVQITMKDVALFDTGQVTLRPNAEQLIRGFVPFFKTVQNNIVVEGYTDNQPIDTPIYPSNWELSAARAMSVVHFLNGTGIDPNRLSGTGYGEYHSVASNKTAAGRQLNRRVNIVVLRKQLLPGTVGAQPNGKTMSNAKVQPH